MNDGQMLGSAYRLGNTEQQSYAMVQWTLGYVRDMPREVQGTAFEKSMIPYIPADLDQD
jgi:hypothetical protein